MKRPFVSLLVSFVALGVLTAGCTQAAPAPTAAPAKPAAPTAAPAAATAAPTKPAAAPAQPTAVPAKKVDFPTKGSTITWIIPYAAGGPSDTMARTMAPILERDLGVSLSILNKAGANTLLGMTDVVRAKADGYTLGLIDLPTLPVAYLDPESKSPLSKADFQPVANIETHSSGVTVLAESPHKTFKDLVDTAKAQPFTVKFGTTGMMTTGAFPGYFLEEVSGAKFAFVHFEGGAPAMTALLGGHSDVTILNPSLITPQLKAGKVRVLATTAPGDKENAFLPGVKSMMAQGYDVQQVASYGVGVRSGTPKEVVDVLSNAMKKAMESDELKKKMDEVFLERGFLDTAQYTAYWDQMENTAKRVLNMVRSRPK